MARSSSGLGWGSLTMQCLLKYFNLVFFMGGVVLIIVGAVAQGFFKDYIQFFDDDLKTPAMGLILLGVVIVIVSFFGWCGAKMENIFMLRVFAFLLCLLLVCEAVAGITVAVLRSDVERVMTDNMNNSMGKYKNDSLVKSAWDNIQENLHCCGTHNYTDWYQTPFSKAPSVPDSCCKQVTTGCGETAFASENLFQTGCADSLIMTARHNLGSIIGVAVGITFIQLIGIWMSCCLIRLLKEYYERL